MLVDGDPCTKPRVVSVPSCRRLYILHPDGIASQDFGLRAESRTREPSRRRPATADPPLRYEPRSVEDHWCLDYPEVGHEALDDGNWIRVLGVGWDDLPSFRPLPDGLARDGAQTATAGLVVSGFLCVNQELHSSRVLGLAVVGRGLERQELEDRVGSEAARCDERRPPRSVVRLGSRLRRGGNALQERRRGNTCRCLERQDLEDRSHSQPREGAVWAERGE